MTYYIKDSFNGTSIRFSIFDKMGNLKYKVLVQYLPFIMSIDVYNMLGQKVARIKQKNMIILYSYNIHTKSKSFKININLENPDADVKIKGMNWNFRGSVAQKTFTILDSDGREVMSQKADTLEKEISYMLNINDEANCIPCLCIALCVDTILTGNLKDAVFFSENKSIKKESCASSCSVNKMDN